ncbi:Leishmanolysin-like peptidase [Lamellibrachia satsuma]|nr:Leishmanolysin-like peptidase [Lamellibrachia satsuma]
MVIQIYHTYLGEPTRVVRKRSIDQKMRIHVHFDPETIPQLDAKLKNIIEKELIPKSVEYFKNTLKVRSVKAPIRLQRTCNGTVYYRTDDPIHRHYCVGACDEAPTCGPVKIPAEHLTGCYRMDGDKPIKKGSDGAGVNTDFILYVSAKKPASCGTRLKAFASCCQLEHALDRPVAGYVNICPQTIALAGVVHLQASVLATVKHEIYHALGFSRGLFGYYRDKDGSPVTKRNKSSGRPPVKDGKTIWSSNITKIFERKGWKNVTMLVTPTVVREARRHFGCATLEGAELEDQGGSGTKISHWEKRVFENEAMTGIVTQNAVFSRVTLALMEDTGWYRVNYKMAEPLLHGYGKGCDFAKKSCKEYMQIKTNASQSLSPYCDVWGLKRLDKLTCTHERKAVAYCSLQKSNKIIDSKYQPFTSIDGVNASDIPSYGGAVVIADYCPFLRNLKRYIASDKVGDSQCAFPDNQIADDRNYLRELYSSGSVCLRHKEKWAMQRTGSSAKTYTTMFGGGCYKINCASEESGGLTVYVDEIKYECKTEGQELSVVSSRKLYTYTGVIICPPYKEVCVAIRAEVIAVSISIQVQRYPMLSRFVGVISFANEVDQQSVYRRRQSILGYDTAKDRLGARVHR